MRNSGTTSSAKGILIDTSNNVRVEGITVRNSGYIAIYVASSDNITVVNCTTEHSRLTGIHVTLCDNIDVSYNLVKYTQCPATDHDHDTWTGFSEECISIEASSNVDVHHNRVYKLIDSWGGEGINVKNGASYVYVYNNLVDHALENGQESTRCCMGVDAWTQETHHIYFYNNILKDGSWGLVFNSEEGGDTHHLYAWNNIIIHCGWSTHGGGIGLPHWGGSPGTVEYGYFWNNIIYDSYYGAYFNKEEISNIFVQNNIFYNSAAADIQWGDSPQGVITLDHNLLSSTDPKFVNASGGNFHLMPDSPAINAGVTIPNVTDDFDGITRPQGAGYDIGAYEYVSVSGPKTYYVDSDIGNDANNCSQARNPSTPKRTVNSIMSCNPGAGDIVKFRGTFTQTISPTSSGEVLYAFQPIQGVSGSTVTFNTSISGLDSATDYVTVYNSRKGNSGAFAVVSFSGTAVTVDTSDLPLGSFITETAADPGHLHGAILRPVHFTAWDKNNPPVFDTYYQTFYSNGKAVVMASYLHSISGKNHEVWPAIEIDSLDLTDSDYIIFDHLEIENAATGIAVEYRDFQSNYDIIQHNYIHDTGYQGAASDEMIYFGNAYSPDRHHDYVQIMYNKIGPHRFTTGVVGDGIEVKPSVHNPTIFGNEITGIVCYGCDDAPIKTTSVNSFIANNYLHDINPIEYRGCGISIIDDYPNDSTGGASGAIVMNNIVTNVRGVGIRVLDASGVKILNNVIYNILPEPESIPGYDPTWNTEENWGIGISNYQGPTENIVIKNNIVHSTNIGIGRYIWAKDYPVSIDSNYNLVFNTTYPFRGIITQNTHDLLLDPMFVDPENGDFHLQSSSPAIDNGTALSDVSIDFDSISRPQGSGYDIGAYEHISGQPIPGDLNNDGSVNILDLSLVAGHFGQTNTHPQWNVTADVSTNNEIDIYDIVFVASRFS
jgi:parallel beta-helix repeat protein